MKHPILSKLTVLFFGVAAALVLTPSCRAQSEISPDHFDGTDSWATAARRAPALPYKQPSTKPSLQAKSQKELNRPAFQLAAAREVTKPASREAAAIDRKRKPAASHSEKP